MKLIDISLPIHNDMWAYKPQWRNNIELFESTMGGDASTVYKLTVFSHSGTYIETSSHKLKSELLLNDLSLKSFYREVKLVISDEEKIITRSKIAEELIRSGMKIEKGDAVIIANGYGKNHRREDYLSASPSFDPGLTAWLSELKIGLIGVDTPIIENPDAPYQPVAGLFTANPELLLLAPLNINIAEVKSGSYTLCCLPLNVENTTGMLCRPVLINKEA
jgi:kynurenine formamidase